MAVLLALGAAASWGAADFLGGVAGRRGGRGAVLRVTVLSQVVGLVLVAPAAFALAAAPATSADLLWGALAGVGGGAGVALLYRGLARGRMSVIAPITAAGAAVIPVVVGVVLGERPPPWTTAGVVAALVAIVLVSRVEDGAVTTAAAGSRAGLPEALAAGLGFALVLIALDRTGEATGLLPLVPMKASAVALVAALALVRRVPLRGGGQGVSILVIGVLDAAAIVAYLGATRVGLLPVVAVVGSLYPVGTVILARVSLDERLTRTQLAGLALALVGVALIAAG